MIKTDNPKLKHNLTHWVPYPMQADHIGLSHGARQVLRALLHFATLQRKNQHASLRRGSDLLLCWAANETLAEYVGASTRTIQKGMRQLVKLGLITDELRDQDTNLRSLSPLQARLDELAPLCEVDGHRPVVKKACLLCEKKARKVSELPVTEIPVRDRAPNLNLSRDDDDGVVEAHSYLN
jgi:hypothetical protein